MSNSVKTIRGVTLHIFLLSLMLCGTVADAQIVGTTDDLLDDTTGFNATPLQVRRHVALPDNGTNGSLRTRQIISMTNRVGDPNAYYSVSQDGRIHRITENGSGMGVATEWFNVNSSIDVSSTNGAHGGLRAIAFHPDFDQVGSAGYGKFYGSMMAANQNASANFLGNSTGNTESVVAEWTFNHTNGQIGGFRELFRVRNPQFDHPIKTLKFNDTATQSDSDYGLLYIAHGDGSVFSVSDGTGQNTSDALGKILRINPIDPDGGGPARYTTPGNQFASDGNANTLAEVYSYGHRNPHNLTFAKRNGQSHLLVADIGADLIEEVNLSVNGGNFGWGEREGTFEKIADEPGVPGRGYGIRPDTGNPPGDQNSGRLLQGNDGGNDFIYPVLQLDHNDVNDNLLVGIVGGPVIGETYFYGNFGGNSLDPGGEIYGVSVDDLLAQNTSLGIGQTVDDLTWIDDHEQYMLSFDHDNNPLTPDLLFDDFSELLTQDIGTLQTRSDIRFGMTIDGRMLISSKRNGVIYVVTGFPVAVPEPGSFFALFCLMAFGIRTRKR